MSTPTSSDHPSQRPMLTRQDTELGLLSYYQSDIANKGLGLDIRPHSKTRSQLRRSGSGDSTSSSDYSTTDSSLSEYSSKDAESEAPPSLRPRSSLPSEGARDRRRIGIIQMDNQKGNRSDGDASALAGNLRARRGLDTTLNGLALVAPPDAAPRAYASLEPPSTAPITSVQRDTLKVHSTHDTGHHRSASEVASTRPSREIGKGGISSTPRVVEPSPANAHRIKPGTDPIHQTHSLLSNPTPPLTLSALHATKRRSADEPMSSPIITPSIGESKRIDMPVAAPVIVPVSPESADIKAIAFSQHQPSPSASPSKKPKSLAHYEPGLHATAGPLPEPPRVVPIGSSKAPPRPPRLHSPSPHSRPDPETMREALKLPAAVTAVLASKPFSSVVQSKVTADVNDTPRIARDPNLAGGRHESGSQDVEAGHKPHSSHRREAAGSSLTEETTPHPKTEINTTKPISNDEIDDLTTPTNSRYTNSGNSDQTQIDNMIVEPPPRHHSLGLPSSPNGQQEEGWVPIGRELASSPESKRTSTDASVESAGGRSSLSGHEHTGATPSPPPKSFRSSFTNGLKRMSLPRSPSRRSSSRSSSIGHGVGQHVSKPSSTPALPPLPLDESPALRTVSPEPPTPPRRIQRGPRIKSTSPDAMFCHEVLSIRNAQERCLVYAQKINELCQYDCGLSDWMIEVTLKTPVEAGPSHPSATNWAPQPRHSSRSSMISEATFPRRPDAYTATDLTQKSPIDNTPPPLPYPSLAQQTRVHAQPQFSRSSSSNSSTPPSSLRLLQAAATPSKTGFFASLGRKASLRGGKEKPMPALPASSSHSHRLTKSPPANATPQRPPINIVQNPTVPGGPRAAPNRMSRSQTLMISSPITSRTSIITKRPSLNDMTEEVSEPIEKVTEEPDPEFAKQVEKLAVLLPHANKDILASYLRRTGQDMLAIGQYIEDEKNGTLRHE